MTTVEGIVRTKSASGPLARASEWDTLLVFHLAGQAYGLPLRSVQEVVPMTVLSRPPTLPVVLAGFLNLGGSAVPVLHLNRLLGVADFAVGLHTPLLVL